jgi:CYTH domain-containing protein
VAREIERKFLVRTDAWRALESRRWQITDGLLPNTGDRKVRVRIRDGQATMAYKGAREGLARDEFEYLIPLEDARHLLAVHCEGRVLSKTRHEVPHEGFLWEVDVYDAPLHGVILAEVELPDEATDIPLPDWVGDEVTGQARYRKVNMQAERMAERAVPDFGEDA